MKHHVSLLIIFVTVEASRYDDYSGARMPHYSIEYDNRDPAPLADEYSDRSPDAAVSFDYKYEEGQRGSIDHSGKEVEWHQTNKKRKLPLKAIEVDENDQEDIPKFKSNRRIQKHRPRAKNLKKESNRRRHYNRNRNDDLDDIDDRNGYKLIKERSRGNDKPDTDSFDLRDTTRRLARRKPRDRTLKAEKFDEIKDNLIHFKENESDDDSTVIVYEKERRMQATEKIPGFNLKQENNQEYDEYYDMQRVHKLKNKLPLLFRQTKVVPTVSNVAERELKAVLGHRQRKEVHSPAGALPTTFPPNAVDPAFEDEWKTFIQNKSTSLKQTAIAVILIINCLMYYGLWLL